jgi:hypothetical protein
MKYTLCLCLLLPVSFLRAQENIRPTDHFTIEGKIKAPFIFSLDSAVNFSAVIVDSVIIYNHLLVRRRALKGVKGILLKDILGKVEFDAPGPKILSEFFITCVGSDNYKVVFSWNELFNTDVGKQAIIITEENGRKEAGADGRIALLCPADYATGRRFVKGLEKIIIERVK